MRKIANTHELQSRLERILAYAGSQQPSRAKLASELRDLSQRVAADSEESPDADELNGWKKKFDAEVVEQTIELGNFLRDFARNAKRVLPPKAAQILKQSVAQVKALDDSLYELQQALDWR